MLFRDMHTFPSVYDSSPSEETRSIIIIVIVIILSLTLVPPATLLPMPARLRGLRPQGGCGSEEESETKIQSTTEVRRAKEIDALLLIKLKPSLQSTFVIAGKEC
jgi:hypothetical protein